MTALRFTEADVDAARAAWGCNCGPAAVAAVRGMSLDEVRPHLGDFERKRYTNPTLMWAILTDLKVRWSVKIKPPTWPMYGLARIQWHGPWMKPGVDPRAAYRHTHWIGVDTVSRPSIGVFDVNCMNSGGWVHLLDWKAIVVPAILEACVPRADGEWSLTHAVEVARP